jgi:DtxR family transcriptional regulator, Mn-dependent transcriptional regulator
LIYNIRLIIFNLLETCPGRFCEIMTVSHAMQRYAAEIYRLQQEYAQVPLSLLSAQIDASTQAVALMVRRLAEASYLIHEPYRGVRLTPEGEKIAMPPLRRHRLVEVFLVRVMGYDWVAAHELADTFERGINLELEERMYVLSGKPTRCPHGEPIPSQDGEMPILRDAPLVDLPAGSACIISRVRTHDLEKLRYIGELGLFPGKTFSLLTRAPFKGPLRLSMSPEDPVISYDLASSLWVELIEPGQ